MVVSAPRSKLEPDLQTPVGVVGLVGPMHRAKWNVAVLSELAEPGRMVLIPVVGREGRVGDFMWRRASPTVTLMLGCAGEDLSERTLTQVLGAGALRDALFETCHRAFLNRSPQTAAVTCGDWRGRLVAHPSSAGVTAVLTCALAIERVIAAQRVLRELQGRQRSGADATIACTVWQERYQSIVPLENHLMATARRSAASA